MGDRTSRKITPQEAKRHSYERDCVNNYWAGTKGVRKGIPRFKAASHRQERHAEEEQLRFAAARALSDDESFEGVERKIASARFKGRNPERKKRPDQPLVMHLAVKALRSSGKVGPELPIANRREAVRKQLGEWSSLRKRLISREGEAE